MFYFGLLLSQVTMAITIIFLDWKQIIEARRVGH